MWGIMLDRRGFYHCYVSYVSPVREPRRTVCSTRISAIRWVQERMYDIHDRRMDLDEIERYIEVQPQPTPQPEPTTLFGVFKKWLTRS